MIVHRSIRIRMYFLSGNYRAFRSKNSPVCKNMKGAVFSGIGETIKCNPRLYLCDVYMIYKSYESSLVYNTMRKDFTTLESYHRNDFILCPDVCKVSSRNTLFTEQLFCWTHATDHKMTVFFHSCLSETCCPLRPSILIFTL